MKEPANFAMETRSKKTKQIMMAPVVRIDTLGVREVSSIFPKNLGKRLLSMKQEHKVSDA